MAVGEDYHYCSDSDDDDDVDRYVFLARQPEPARRHEEDGASDHDDDETEDEGRRRRGEKRPLIRDADVSDDASPYSPKKKARLGLIIALPPAEQMQPSGTDPYPSGVQDTESSDSEETHDEHPDPRKGKGDENIKTKRKPFGVCGKRKRADPRCEEVDQEPHRHATAAKTGPSAAATSALRFPCSLCQRCFGSYQALGGHVLGHQKKARIAAIAVAPSLDGAGGRGTCTAEVAAVELDHQDANSGADHRAEHRTSVAAPDANVIVGNRHEKDFDDIDDAACREDNVDTGGHTKSKKKKKRKTSVVAGEDRHMSPHGDGNIARRMSAFEASHEAVNGHDRNREKASSSSSGSEETAIRAGSRNDAGVKNKKAAHNGGAANGNGNADACRTQQYKCKICGRECPTGRALGGHMRKHRKQPEQGAGGDGRPATDGDGGMHVSRQFGATGLYRALVIAGEASG